MAFFVDLSNFQFLANFLSIFRARPHAKSMGGYFRFFSLSFDRITTKLDTNNLFHGPILACALFQGSSIFARFAGLWRFKMGVYGKLRFKSLLLLHLSMDLLITGYNCSLPWSNTGVCFFRRLVKFLRYGFRGERAKKEVIFYRQNPFLVMCVLEESTHFPRAQRLLFNSNQVKVKYTSYTVR